MVALEIRGLEKTFEGTPALTGVTCEAFAGETLALLGPNGAGKSTTLRCVAGILGADAGRIYVHGHPAGSREARQLLSLLPEEPELYPGLTVGEHLRFIALAYRVEDWQSRAHDLLERFSLTDRADWLPGALSHGMRRKLALAMALLHEARVVLLDEPFNGLDPRAAFELKKTIRDLAVEGTAVVVATHLLAIAEEIADRAVVIQEGRVVATGSLPELRNQALAAADASLEQVFLKLTEEANV